MVCPIPALALKLKPRSGAELDESNTRWPRSLVSSRPTMARIVALRREATRLSLAAAMATRNESRSTLL